MGYSRWDQNTYAAYASAATSTLSVARSKGMSDTAARRTLFKESGIKPEFDPRNIVCRESRDSDLNPCSTPIILGVDVTGSMGVYAEKLAIEGLGKLVDGILTRKPVTDPHIMAMAIGDVFCDQAPLQASQFESDIRIAEQLTGLYLEAGGGGNGFESYDIPWLFAATKTSTDAWEKRQKKGYIFTIGDEPPPDATVSAYQLNQLFGSGFETGYTPAQMLAMAQERYQVFHVIVEQGSHYRHSGADVTAKWQKLLGARALHLSDANYLSEVIISAMQISETGASNADEIINSWENPAIINVLKHAFGQ